MALIKRAGNFGIVDTPHGMMSFSVGQGFSTFENTASYHFGSPDSWNNQHTRVGNFDIIPQGITNDLPLELQRVLDESYIGEGILGKIQGLQWGDGPRLYAEEETADGSLHRRWKTDNEIYDFIDSCDGMNKILRCHTDMVHGLGYYIKLKRNLGYRIGEPGFIADVEHVPVNNARLEWPGLDSDTPRRIVVGSFPSPDTTRMYAYPIWDKKKPFQHAVSMRYQSLYSFCKASYSTPRFFGALNWMRLSNAIAPLLIAYNKNASAISYHIESPQEYWDNVKDMLEKKCAAKGEIYTGKMLEDYKDAAFEKFSGSLTGTENVGKFLHTTEFFNHEAHEFQGWKITPIDKKIKEYVDAQIAIANKGDSAATSGFGISPSLSNIIIDGKLSSGSEMLYALKGYFATETAIPEMVLFQPWNDILKVNFPGKNLKLGFYRNPESSTIQPESKVSPTDRMKNNS
jgi:hypothetical protein